MKIQQIIFIMIFFLMLASCKKTHLTNDFCDCADSQSTYLVDTVVLFVPNVFTPNGDGNNDRWVIDNFDHFSGAEVKVTRPGLFGCTVYESSSDQYIAWDGTKENNKPIKDGKYNYEISINGQTLTGKVCVYEGSTEPDNYDCLNSCAKWNNNDPVIPH